MDHMSRRVRHLWAAALVGLLSTVVIPATAWADQTGVSDVLKRRPKSSVGFGGVFGLLCCLVIVGAIVLVVFLVMRNRRKG
jgi:uncharacterized membrane protein